MPYPSEHACRIKEPGSFQDNSFRRIKNKDLVMIIGKPNGQDTTTTQAYRYPISDWDEARARKHCKEAGGRFEPAAKEEKVTGRPVSYTHLTLPTILLV